MISCMPHLALICTTYFILSSPCPTLHHLFYLILTLPYPVPHTLSYLHLARPSSTLPYCALQPSASLLPCTTYSTLLHPALPCPTVPYSLPPACLPCYAQCFSSSPPTAPAASCPLRAPFDGERTAQMTQDCPTLPVHRLG